MSLTNVPQAYMGVWQRTLLEQADMVDTTSLVLWLQTDLYHIDIRIPANRPLFTSINQLEDCSFDQLSWLTTQQGFTGITQINGNTAEWIRDHDFQPLNGQRDIGEMKFETDDSLIETGIDANYLERWERIPSSHFNLSVRQIIGENRHDRKVPARIFTANSTFAFVRPRNMQLPNAASISAAIDIFQPSKEALLDWLDFEITFGEIIDEHYGYVKHSTFPFREGKEIKLI
jgi:hypothetical protein